MNNISSEGTQRRSLLYRAPMVSVAGALVGGIILGRYVPLAAGFWCVLGAGGLIAAIVTFFRRHLRQATAAAIAVTVLAIGAAYVRLCYFSVAENHIVTYTAEHRTIFATLRGRVLTQPQILDDSQAVTAGYRRGIRTSFVLSVEKIRTQTGWGDTSGLVRVTIDAADNQLSPGQTVELIGTLGRFRPPANPGQFDWSASARNQQLFVWMRVHDLGGATVLKGRPRAFYSRLVWHFRAAARQHWMACGDARSGRLLNALIIGERHPALRTLNRTMVRAGIAHFLSISGLHLGVFLGFLYLLCRLIRLQPRQAAWCVLVVLAGYVLLAEPRAPLLRSAIMAACLCLAAISRRHITSLNALALSAVILLGIDPLQLFSAGFQLSFAIVGGLIVLHHPVQQLLFGSFLRRRGLMVFRGTDRTRRWLYFTAGNWLISGLVLVITAHAVAIPLVAYHFSIFSPYAPLLSVLLFPLVLGVLVCGYVSIFLQWPMPNLSYAVGRLAGSAADKLAEAVTALRHLPALAIELRPLGVWWVLLCYGFLGLVLVCRRIRFGRTLAVAALLILAGATAYTQRPAGRPAAAELNLLAVGAGQCAVLQTPAGKTYLIDAGTQSGYDVYENVLRPFLQYQGLPTPSAAFISHANSDHYNALEALLKQTTLPRVYLNDYFGRVAPHPAVEELMAKFAHRRVEVIRLRAGQSVSLDGRTRVDVLWPTKLTERQLRKISINDRSLVLRITCDEKTILLTGDLNSTGQRALLARPEALKCDVLVLPHHGGWEQTLPAFVSAATPEYMLISCARRPEPLANAADEAKRFYARLRTNPQLRTTSRNGWIQVRFGGGKIRIQTMR